MKSQWWDQAVLDKNVLKEFVLLKSLKFFCQKQTFNKTLTLKNDQSSEVVWSRWYEQTANVRKIRVSSRRAPTYGEPAPLWNGSVMEILSVSRGKWRESRTGRCRVTTGTVVEITRQLEEGKANFPRELRKERLRKVAWSRDVNTSQVHAGDSSLEPHKIEILPQESTSSRYRVKWICWAKIQTYSLTSFSFYNCRNGSTPTENAFENHFVTDLLII